MAINGLRKFQQISSSRCELMNSESFIFPNTKILRPDARGGLFKTVQSASVCERSGQGCYGASEIFVAALGYHGLSAASNQRR